MKLELPEALCLREESIRTALHAAVQAGGETGACARMLEAILLPHLEKEDTEILQMLALLAPLAAGEIDPKMDGAVPDLDAMRERASELSVEHTAIIEAGSKLLSAAQAEGVAGVAEFAGRLLVRVRLDEEVFYPTALLIRRHLNLLLSGAA